MNNLAPIIIFCYNRPEHLRKTLESLSKNDLAEHSTLFIFCDGPKLNATPQQLDKIKQTRKIAKSEKWCKEVHIIEQVKNKGLADSIVNGVTEIVNKYGKVIVLEDDLITAKGFLKYMNEALELYENEEKVMHISGYMYPHKETLQETFFYRVTMCWGWATWKRAWKHYNNDAIELWKKLIQKNDVADFDKYGGDYLSSQLFLNIEGNLKTWFIKWNTTVYLLEGLSLFPNVSLVENIGFDGTGENCGIDYRFNNNLKKYITVFPIDLLENKDVRNIISSFLYPPNNQIKKQKTNNFSSFFKNNRFTNRILEKLTHHVFQKLSNKFEKSINDQKNYKSYISRKAKVYEKSKITFSVIQNYTYIAQNAIINNTLIGKFCSIGPNLLCGWGIHPTNGISTAPMFYSTLKQNGITLSKEDKIEELKPITIGNDVFIGMNVTILDGVTIGDGAIIGAGAVVNKDIPPYAIAVGNPIRIVKYRFEENVVKELLELKWWNLPEENLKLVEQYFWDINTFIQKIKELKQL